MANGANPIIAVYTGVFDPVHLGHLDVIIRGSKIFDRLIVGVGINPEKEPFFSIEERVQLVKRVSSTLPNVEVLPFSGLAVRFVREVGAYIMLRGLRTTSDMEYEFTMSLTNLALAPEIETVFLMAKETFSHISSTLLRQIASLGGELNKFVPPEIKAALEKRARERREGS
jgi:pantetheine-phosphate adenylyltransferase